MEKFPDQNERERFNEYKQKFERFIEHEISDHHIDKVLLDIQAKANDLRQKYGEQVLNNAWYHMVIGSTPSQVESPSYQDFSGEDSIADFIDSLQK